MKKLCCVLLCLLLLSGCSHTQIPEAEPAPTEIVTQIPSESEAPAPSVREPGLYPLAVCTDESHDQISSYAVSGDEVVLLLMHWDPEDDDAFLQVFQFIDLSTGELKARVPVEACENGELYQISFTEDGSLLLSNPYLETAAVFDRSGELLRTIENPLPAKDPPQFDHLLTNNWFTYQDDFAFYHLYGDDAGYLYSAYAFPEEPEALYLVDGGFDTVSHAIGHRLLETNYLPDGKGLCYRVLDLDAGAVLHTQSFEIDALDENAACTFLNAVDAMLLPDGALLHQISEQYEAALWEAGLYGEDGEYPPERQETLYLWRFSEEQPSPVSVRRVTADDLAAENEAIAARIGALYDIHVLLDTAPEGDVAPLMEGDDFEALADAPLITGIEPLKTYDLLIQLERFLQKLPEGFTREMQTDFPEPVDEFGQEGFEGFDIYVVREIPGLSSAYANGWEQRMRIVLATDEFSSSILPHEFMHLIERRIHAWYEANGESFWELWDACNPEGFGYCVGPDDTDTPDDWFVSRYAMTDSMEDRADTFEYLFNAAEPLEDCWWYKDLPHVQAKVALLQEAIRNAYPSVQAVDRAYWEK